MQVKIEPTDIEGSGHGNSNDPLVRAMERTTGQKTWRSEVFSQGQRMRQGTLWNIDSSNYFLIDEVTTKALQDFDEENIPFVPCQANLLEDNGC